MVAEMLALTISKESDLRLVGVAGNIADALVLVLKEQPDVVLMDYRLPDGDGIEAVKKILDKLPETRIVMLTGSGSADLLARSIEGRLRRPAQQRPSHRRRLGAPCGRRPEANSSFAPMSSRVSWANCARRRRKRPIY